MPVDQLKLLGREGVFLVESRDIFEDVLRAEYFCLLKIHLLPFVVVEGRRKNGLDHFRHPQFQLVLLHLLLVHTRKVNNDLFVPRLNLKVGLKHPDVSSTGRTTLWRLLLFEHIFEKCQHLVKVLLESTVAGLWFFFREEVFGVLVDEGRSV